MTRISGDLHIGMQQERRLDRQRPVFGFVKCIIGVYDRNVNNEVFRVPNLIATVGTVDNEVASAVVVMVIRLTGSELYLSAADSKTAFRASVQVPL